MVTSLSRRGAKILNAVSDYLYGEAQGATTRDQRDEWSLTLALLGAVRRGSTVPFQEACFVAFGGTLERYQEYRNKEKWLAKREWFAALPDYDPVEAERVQRQNKGYRKRA